MGTIAPSMSLHTGQDGVRCGADDTGTTVMEVVMCEVWGDPDGVIDEAFDLASGTAPKITETGQEKNIEFFLYGGVFCGVLGLAATDEITKKRLTGTARTYNAVSVGGLTMISHCLGMTRDAEEIYFGVMADIRQLSILTKWTPPKLGMRILESLDKRAGYIINDPALKNVNQELYVLAKHELSIWENIFSAFLPQENREEVHRLNVKEALPDPRAALYAAMCLPPYMPPWQVNGKLYSDCAWVNNKKVFKAARIEERKPTSVIFVCNRWGQVRDPELRRLVQVLTSKHIRCMVIGPSQNESYSPLTTDADVIRGSIQSMRSFVKELLDRGEERWEERQRNVMTG
ncbi:MAG: patatin-like phospholipase family protein [Nitrososphaera sp.]|nr:patatin-like phospholipase family protein [Nitrososphaera sp.]